MELYIEHDAGRYAVRFFFVESRPNGKVFYGMKEGKLTEQFVNHGEVPATELLPLLELNWNFAQLFIKSIADHAAKNEIRTENENHIKGKLDATESHLGHVLPQFDFLLKEYVKLATLESGPPILMANTE